MAKIQISDSVDWTISDSYSLEPNNFFLWNISTKYENGLYSCDYRPF